MSAAHVCSNNRREGLLLDLPYRKERSYIHSADIFKELSSLAKENYSPDAYVRSLVLRTHARRRILVCFEKDEKAFGRFSIRTQAVDVPGYLVESEAEVRTRVPYDESDLRHAVIGTAPSARFAAPIEGYSAFEHLLVLMKITGSLGSREAWLCQVNFSDPLDNRLAVAVTFQYVLQGFHAFEVAQNGRTIGSAYAKLRIPNER